MKNLNLQKKLLGLMLLPLIGMIILGTIIWNSQYSEYENLKKIDKLIVLSTKISYLVHETQKERGMTAGYLGSQGKKFKDKLPSQRELSNGRFNELEEYVNTINFLAYPNNLKDDIHNAIDKFKNLTKIRKQVDTLDIKASDAIGYYTNMNAIFLNNVSLIAKLSTNDSIAKAAIAYSNFLLGKERAGIERAVGSNTFSKDSFNSGMKNKWIQLISEQNTYMNSFLSIANDDVKKFYNETLQGDDISEVIKMRNIALVEKNENFGVDASYWFEQITSKINKLKKTDDYIAELLINETKAVMGKNLNSLISNIVLILIIIVIAVFVSYLGSRSVSNDIKNFSNGLLNFFSYLNRETNEVKLISINSNDEIGMMAKLVNENIQKTEKYIEEDRKFIDETVVILKDFEQGDLSQRINSSVSNPSLNELKNVLNAMGKNLESNTKEVLKVLDNYTKYDFMGKIDCSSLKNHLLELSLSVNNLGDSITSMLSNEKKVGLTLQNSSNILLENVNLLNNVSNEAAASLEETAAALEEITGTIISNTENVVKMADVANLVTKSVDEGNKLAHETTSSMDEINEQVSSINEAIIVIDQIAFQTNILSLNAAVEAATAGEAGKGFAVVAQEVRNLASRAAEAAKEIKNIVENATIKANNGKNIADKMIHGYEDLYNNIRNTIELINQVRSASQEQKLGIEQINDAVSNQDRQTQQIASAATHTQEIASQTSIISKEIVRNVDKKEFAGKNDIIGD